MGAITSIFGGGQKQDNSAQVAAAEQQAADAKAKQAEAEAQTKATQDQTISSDKRRRKASALKYSLLVLGDNGSVQDSTLGG